MIQYTCTHVTEIYLTWDTTHQLLRTLQRSKGSHAQNTST